jgi:hypothetical protein
MLQIVYEAETYDIIAIQLISVPNGQLYKIYGDAIVGKGKAGSGKGKSNKTWSMRYVYSNNHVFDTLDGKPIRVKFIYFKKPSGKCLIQNKSDITVCDDIT